MQVLKKIVLNELLIWAKGHVALGRTAKAPLTQSISSSLPKIFHLATLLKTLPIRAILSQFKFLTMQIPAAGNGSHQSFILKKAIQYKELTGSLFVGELERVLGRST